MSDIVKVYSNAMFQLSVEENVLNEVQTDLSQIAEVFKSQEEFLKLLSSPVVTAKEKVSMLEKVFQGHCNELVYNFLCVLAEKNRMLLFCDIQQDFSKQYDEHNDILQVEVTTSIPLTDELRKGIVAKLTKDTGKNITIVETVDSSILGGIIIRYNNTVIDDSIKSRFKDLSKQLHKH
jgi:F-type H+-transporting ATPase subunit delta